MLKSFIDDSGNDARSPVFILAGYMASIDEWDRFSADWQGVLDIRDPRPMRKMRMSDAHQSQRRDSVFYGFSEKQIEDRLKKFCLLTSKHARHAVVSVIPKEPYKRYFRGKFETEALNRPYLLSFIGIIRSFMHITKSIYPHEKIEFVFDTEDREDKSEIIRQYELFASLAPDVYKSIICGGTPDFRDDGEVLPLQAADLLAWHARRYYYELNVFGRPPSEHASNVYFAHLCDLKHDIIDVWTDERLAAAANAIGTRRLRLSDYGAWSARASTF